MEKLFSKKDCGDAQIITIIVLIVVAVGLLVIFRNRIAVLVNQVMDKATSAITSLFNSSSGESASSTWGDRKSVV